MSSAEQENNKDVFKKTESRRIATPRQIDFLIDFLRDNEELRSSRVQRSKGAIYIIRRLWDVCSEKLNRMGPARNAKEWAKYWSDLKSRTKQKSVEINKRACNAGEGSSNGLNLSYAEKRIVRLLEYDEQMKNVHEVPLDQSSGGSSFESMVFASVKEEKDEDNTQVIDMNVEDFITTAPVVDDIRAVPSDKMPPLQPATNHTHSINVSLPLPPSLQGPLITLHPPAQGPPPVSANNQLSPNNPGPAMNRPQSVPPPRVSTTPKRRRRRARVMQSYPNRSCLNPECINCIELKEFCDVMLKLEESHAKTTKLQTEASLKMTEVLKLQAEGILHTGVALREMATNLCRLLEGQAFSGRTITI